MKSRRTALISRITILLLVGALFSGCATNPVSGKSDFVLMSEEQEIELGKHGHQQVLKQYKVYEDAELQAYVERLGQKLAFTAHPFEASNRDRSSSFKLKIYRWSPTCFPTIC